MRERIRRRAGGYRVGMRALQAIPRIAELSLEAAKQAGSLAVSVARTVAEPVFGRHGDNGSHGSTTAPPPPRTTAPERDEHAGDGQRSATATAAAAPPPTAPAPVAAPSRPVAVPDAPDTPDVADVPDVALEPPEPAPEHVDREAVVVAESADAGAADGAGAQIRVDEPWDGYSHLNAKDVVAQLATADPATLAVVRLYETANRNRRTVLAEIDRRLVSGS